MIRYIVGTKSAIEAVTGLSEGTYGYATDTDEPGTYNGSVWAWGAGGSGIPMSYLDTDGTLAANSDSKVATQKATKTYVDTAVTGLLEFKGAINASGSPDYPAALKGDSYVISHSGSIGGLSGPTVDIGDTIVAIADNAGGNHATVGSSWIILEHNLSGVLLAANNLSELASFATARSNLGVSYEIIMDLIATMILNGDHAGITLTYDDPSDTLSIELDESEVNALIADYAEINLINESGWFPVAQTWTYASADDPVYQIYVSGDVTANADYKAGNKVKCTNNSTTFYGLIVKVGSYDGGNNRTPVDVYGGTDYDLANSAITNPNISKIKSPDGFPLNPDKWTLKATDTSDRTQTNPTATTWYNLGSISVAIPIGVWKVQYKVAQRAADASAASVQQYSTLSTANNSESDGEFTMLFTAPTGSNAFMTQTVTSIEKIIALTSKTTHYLNAKTNLSNQDSIAHRGDAATTIIKIVCAYV